MKKIISTIMLLAAAATAFTSCDKQNAEATQSPEESVLVFTSEKPSFDDDVKTEWNEIEKTVYWSEDDYIRVALKVNGVWQNAGNDVAGAKKPSLYKSTKISSEDNYLTADFKVPGSFTSREGVHKFYTFYPSNKFNGDDSSVEDISNMSLELSSDQTLSSDTFDSSADLMIGTSEELEARPTAAIPLRWNRLVAHAYITLDKIHDAVEGELVGSVTLTAQEGASLAGTYVINPETAVVTASVPVNEITMQGSALIDANGDLSFWACMMPCTWTSLKVVVETDKATYTRNIDLSSNQKTFLQNRRNLLTINMADAVRTPKAETNYNGDWLITAIDSDSKIYAASAYTSGNNLPAVEVSISDGVVSSLSDLSSCKMTFNKVASGEYVGLYTIKDASGNYLYAAGATSKNYLKASSTLTENSYWYVNLESDGTYTIKAIKGSAVSKDLMFYRNSNYFSCYNGTQTVVTIYPYPTL